MLRIRSLIFFLTYISIGLLLFVIACDPVTKQEELATSGISETFDFSVLALERLNLQENDWSFAGNVVFDLHEEGSISQESGKDILWCQPEGSSPSTISTGINHGDIDLSFEFMLSPKAMAEVRLMDTYAIMLNDSWGKEEASMLTCGTLFTSSLDNDGLTIESTENVCKAPGLWQHLYIQFRAPRVDAEGKILQEAKITQMRLNNVQIHKNISVSYRNGLDRGNSETNEGPLVIKAKKHPIAFRNIQFKKYGVKDITYQQLRYKLYEGQFSTLDDIPRDTPDQAGEADSITYELGEGYKNYALFFNGNLQIPTTGAYITTLYGRNPAYLLIDGKLVVQNDEVISKYNSNFRKVKLIDLEAGNHTFELVYNKNDGPWRKGFSWFMEGPEVRRVAMHANSSIVIGDPPPPYELEVAESPVFQRGFYYHEGDKKTHTLAVGLPEHINFVYDLSKATLLSAWKGKFVDATNMWHNRGNEQTIEPLGGVLSIASKPSLFPFVKGKVDWPDSLNVEIPLNYKGYSLTEKGVPQFTYQWQGGMIKDVVSVYDHGNGLQRKLTIEDIPLSEEAPMYLLLASGKHVESMEGNRYLVDDKTYYIEISNSYKEKMLSLSQGTEELLVIPLAMNEAAYSIAYNIIW